MKFMVSILLGLNLLVQGTVLPASSCFIPNVTIPLSPAAQTDTAPAADLNISAPSAILMEAFTGAVVYEKNPHEARHPASVTKIMTLLLIFDALSSKQISLDDTVTVSEYAASMGGSQVFLEPGETQTVETMIKCISVASANDACVAMAEHVAGSESEFVRMMNERAKGLGMNDTNFVNCCGLDADGHMTSANDIALMSRELITKYPKIHDYCTIWMENITHTTAKGSSEFGLTNTNKLIKHYQYATGLKTGFTNTAMYCISATAKKDDMELIAVIMKAPTSTQRFEDATNLLNYGFSTYTLENVVPESALPPVPVSLGTQATVQPVLGENTHLLLEKAKAGSLQQLVTLADSVEAPVAAGSQLGTLTITSGEEVVAELPILAGEEIPRVTFGQMLVQMLRTAFLCG